MIVEKSFTLEQLYVWKMHKYFLNRTFVGDTRDHLEEAIKI